MQTLLFNIDGDMYAVNQQYLEDFKNGNAVISISNVGLAKALCYCAVKYRGLGEITSGMFNAYDTPDFDFDTKLYKDNDEFIEMLNKISKSDYLVMRDLPQSRIIVATTKPIYWQETTPLKEIIIKL